jgi:hypothetical protein
MALRAVAPLGEAPMRPFEFIILFLSFIYILGLTHLLFAATRMVRHRRVLIFSWPHALWMFAVLLLLFGNWITLWDVHALNELSLGVIVGGAVISVIQYFICALVSPDFEDGETYDMRAFHERESRTYLGGMLALMVVSLILNYAAGAKLGIQNWANQNALVLAMAPPVLLAFFVRAAWAQLAGAVLFLGLTVAYLGFYYPVLR